MRELFIDCSTGLSGDMLSAALLELCPDRENMLKRLNSFGIPGIEYSAGTVKSYSGAGTHLTVRYLGKEEGANSPDEYHHGLASMRIPSAATLSGQAKNSQASPRSIGQAMVQGSPQLSPAIIVRPEPAAAWGSPSLRRADSNRQAAASGSAMETRGIASPYSLFSAPATLPARAPTPAWRKTCEGRSKPAARS